MQLDAFSNVLTAKQIIALAERKANNPGLNLTPNGFEPGTVDYTTNPLVDSPAYAGLQSLLDQLALTQIFTFKRTAIDFAIEGRATSLPSNYWRVGFADPCWMVSDSAEADRTQFRLLDAQDFHSRFQDGIVGRPLWGYINRDSGDLLVDPAPDQRYILELHYYPWQPALGTVDDRPWFPFTQYLVNALLRDTYFVIQSDDRWQIANAECTRLMKEIKGSMGDDKDRASASIQLNPSIYPMPIEI
jgi:hypothetical protein